MKRILFLVAVAFFVAGAAAADDWSQTFGVSGTPDVHLRVNDGTIKVSSAPGRNVQAAVHAVGYTRGRDYEVQATQTGSRIDLNIRIRSEGFRLFNWGSRSLEVRLVVPATTNLDLDSGDGQVTVADVAGTLRARTADGDIDVRRVRGDLELRTGDGRVTVDSVEGSLLAHTGDGSISARGRFQGLSLETGDGSIDVRVENGSAMSRAWSIRTSDGTVELGLPAGFAAYLDASTSDGDIHSDFPGTPHGGRFEARLNSGAYLLTVRSGDGSISIRRR
jgi:DUF4097 and DUF4098 domain-containing protein YvlB